MKNKLKRIAASVLTLALLREGKLKVYEVAEASE